jgi:hypothetical protein
MSLGTSRLCHGDERRDEAIPILGDGRLLRFTRNDIRGVLSNDFAFALRQMQKWRGRGA